MDDFVISNLHESRNEWCSRLVSIFTPLVAEGVRSLFNEAWKLCLDNDEANKYLMTFQNLLSRVPKWNNTIIEEERKRIIERSGCNYLEDLITCVHIIQLKVLTCVRVGNKQKKIDISIPKLDSFIHKIYINVARKVYSNVYLFEKPVMPLQQQKNNRELELIIQECIMLAIRESVPTESIIRAYLDESVEQEEEVIIENIMEPMEENGVPETKTDDVINNPIRDEEDIPAVVPSIQNMDEEKVVTRLTFNDMDSVLDMGSNSVTKVDAPKTLERLEEISVNRAIQRKLEEEDEDRIQIHGEQIDLSGFDILDEPSMRTQSNNNVLMNDFEELF
jgi:predicted ester cyclase